MGNVETTGNDDNLEYSNCKTIYCIRHAESESNKAKKQTATWLSADFWDKGLDVDIKDPTLTHKGINEIKALKNNIMKHDFISKENIQLIVVSPLIRAIDTCLGIFGEIKLKHKNIKILVHPYLRPILTSTSAVGNFTSNDIKNKFGKQLDCSLLTKDKWWEKDYISNKNNISNNMANDDIKIHYETKDELLNRIKKFKIWLWNRKEKNIIIVGHCGYLRNFLNKWMYIVNCQLIKSLLIKDNIVKFDNYTFQ